MKVKAITTVGRGTYRCYEIFVDRVRRYRESTLTRSEKARFEFGQRHEQAIRQFVQEGNEVTEQIVVL